jgi:hypothetical protein
MIKIKKLESIDQVSKLKQQYIEQTTAPLDGMWLTGFVPMANHYGFYDGDRIIGFCCINDEEYLLQFYISPHKQEQASLLFNTVITLKNSSIEKINGAFVSTAEPHYLSLCLDNFTKFKVNALMYQLDLSLKAAREQDPILQLTVAKPDQLAELVTFAEAAIGAPEQWLKDYFTNLIHRQELFGYRHNGRLLATGECRGYDEYQTQYADIGVIVDDSQRGKGLGTKVLKQLIIISKTRKLQPICSTESTNIGAQKAISRAGFFAGNRIVQFDF